MANKPGTPLPVYKDEENGSSNAVPVKEPQVFHTEFRDQEKASRAEMDTNFKLPITADRTAGWLSSAYHNTTAMVGAGVLGLPYAMKFLGWPGGTVTLVLSWVISLYTLHQLVALHEFNGHRFNRYHELGVYAFGKTWGNIAVITPQLIVMVGLGITYSVTGGQSLKRFWAIVCEKNAEGNCNTSFGLSAWIIVFTGVHLILIQLPNFNALRPVSLAAAIMSMGYSTIAIGGSIAAGKQPGTVYNLNGYSVSAGVLNVFNSLGIVAFAYGGHNVVLEIQSSMRSKKPGDTYRPYMNGVYLAYTIVAWCYFGVSFAGYHSFGKNVKDNVLASIPGPKWMIAMADFFVVIHVIGSYQVYTMPVMDMIECAMVRHGWSNGTIVRLIYRTIYVVIIAFIAISIPFFGSLMGFIGALGTGPTTFWLPSVIWLKLKKPSMGNWNFWASWVCIILGVAITILGAIGGMRDIIVSASGYKFYQ